MIKMMIREKPPYTTYTFDLIIIGEGHTFDRTPCCLCTGGRNWSKGLRYPCYRRIRAVNHILRVVDWLTWGFKWLAYPDQRDAPEGT
ncbi:MAG: hypothetical protein KGI89_02955 [Euryarchaeota archaeon]|nr:hypothetical protein [Euryarchaeota archaeon]